MRLRSLTSVAALAFAVTVVNSVQAQATKSAYPSKPVRWIIPFPPGGATDILGRSLAQKLSESWGQPVVIENRAGASGTIGSDLVAKSTPDGYTLVVGTTSSHAVSPALNPKLPYDNINDFAAVALVATFPNVLLVHPSGPKTLSELIALLKANPGKYNFASSGNGSSTHLAGELFKSMTQTDMTHVPYKGTGPLLNDLMAGHVSIGFDQITAVLPFMQSGKLRALGVASLDRNPAAPDVPAIAEVVPGFEAIAWVGLFAPAGTPPDVVRKIRTDVGRVLQSADGAQKLRELGATPGTLTPEQFAAFVKQDTEKWRELVKTARITAD